MKRIVFFRLLNKYRLFCALSALSCLAIAVGITATTPIPRKAYYWAKRHLEEPILPYSVLASFQVDEPCVALTFDGGPSKENTPRILELLRKYNAKATFVILGREIYGNTDILQQEVREGHELANHTWNHPELDQIPFCETVSEISATQGALLAITGQGAKSIRPPKGCMNNKLSNMIYTQCNLKILMWSVDSNDWRHDPPKETADRVLKHVVPGSIILMHDGTTSCNYEAVEPVIRGLKERGYRLVTVSELEEISKHGHK